MIPAEYYTGVYYNLLLLIVISAVIQNIFRSLQPISVDFRSDKSALLLCLLISLYIGFRPITESHLGDTMTYQQMFLSYEQGEAVPDDADWLFHHLMKLASSVMDVHLFFLCTALIYVGCLYAACKKLFPNNVLVGFFMCITAFSFLGYGVNGIRSGVASSVMILALSYYPAKWKFAIGSLIAIGFHGSMILPVMLAVISWFYSRTRFFYLIWLGCIAISLSVGHYITDFLSVMGFVDDRLSGYINKTNDLDSFSSVGFRWDFVLYSIPPLIMGYYVVFRKGFRDKVYLLFLNTYVLANAFWILVIGIAFSNRFAYLSWFIYPIVLIYPVLKLQMWRQQYGKIAVILLGHFAFTYFMWAIGKL